MTKLVWAQRALAELERLQHGLARRDRDGALRAVRAIREGMRLIEAHPEAGRPAEGLDPEFRERWIALDRDRPERKRPKRESPARRTPDAVRPDHGQAETGPGRNGCLALYRLDGSRVVVLAVRHGRELGY